MDKTLDITVYLTHVLHQVAVSLTSTNLIVNSVVLIKKLRYIVIYTIFEYTFPLRISYTT